MASSDSGAISRHFKELFEDLEGYQSQPQTQIPTRILPSFVSVIGTGQSGQGHLWQMSTLGISQSWSRSLPTNMAKFTNPGLCLLDHHLPPVRTAPDSWCPTWAQRWAKGMWLIFFQSFRDQIRMFDPIHWVSHGQHHQRRNQRQHHQSAKEAKIGPGVERIQKVKSRKNWTRSWTNTESESRKVEGSKPIYLFNYGTMSKVEKEEVKQNLDQELDEYRKWKPKSGRKYTNSPCPKWRRKKSCKNWTRSFVLIRTIKYN